MNAPEYRPGERVKVTIDATIADVSEITNAEVTVGFSCDAAEYAWHLPLGVPGVTIERVAPPEWPPQPGDLWRDGQGALWFIHGNPHESDGLPLFGRTAGGARWTSDIAALTEDYAPLSLVHREESAEQAFHISHPVEGDAG